MILKTAVFVFLYLHFFCFFCLFFLEKRFLAYECICDHEEGQAGYEQRCFCRHSGLSTLLYVCMYVLYVLCFVRVKFFRSSKNYVCRHV